ncbi:MAG: translation initiation factor IF-2 [Cyclobacteriaceae bacterium]|nr:translation initiation factor IF-2 [Cyclobacteriaceae bacterium]
MRLSQVARKLNIGKNTIIEFLDSNGFKIEDNPNFKINGDQLDLLSKEFADSALDKEEASSLSIGSKHTENIVIDSESEHAYPGNNDDEEEILIKGNQYEKKEEVKPSSESVPAEDKSEKQYVSESPKLQGIKVIGKIDLDKKKATPKPEETPKAPAKEEAKEQPAPETVKPEESKKEETPSGTEAPQTPKAPEVPVARETTELPEKKEPKIEIVPEQKVQPEESLVEKPKDEVIAAKAETLKGLKVLGKIELPKKVEKPVASSDDSKDKKKKKRPRKRLRKEEPGQKPAAPESRTVQPAAGALKKKDTRKTRTQKEEPSEKEIQEQIKATLAKLSGSGKPNQINRSKYRREKRSAIAEAHEQEMLREQQDSKILKVNEFISANDLASLMDVSVNKIISACMGLGMFVSINQRLDAEAITIIADEFGYSVEFVDDEENLDVELEEDREEDLEDRAPIVTIMGHVDHGKTSLLDFIRSSKVTEGEAGGITQHIGAYDVTTKSGKRIAFLDTPGHEAFTAMRARGAKLTDIVVVVVAADDNVMPQTKEAINHAMVADVPIIIAINKIDKPGANPDKIREELAGINILVEEWGGKYQSQEISAKTGQGIEDLLEKVLLEAELLELKANKNKNAVGTVVEAELDKGRGYVTTVLVQSGTLKVGDVILAGSHFGKVKAMYDHRGNKVKAAIPSTPVLVLGLDGAPQAGDKFNVMDSDREARDIANKREQLQREQGLRTKKHITLDEIGRRLAIGSFKELNIIIKGDVDGSVEALSDSLLKLSTEEVQINIKHKGVGQISESDVLLASASDGIIVGFQVRPSVAARRLAEQEEIEIRHYSVIYDAINEIKDAMEGMLAPEFEEVITSNVEVREVFKISKVGTIAGCMVTDGTIKRNNRIRVVRDGIVIFTGDIDALKRYKDDVNEVKKGFECGIRIKNFNDIRMDDVIESFEQKEVKRTL